MNASLQLTMSLDPAHRNQYLFADHYLNNLLPGDPRWGAARAEAEAFRAWLQDLNAREQAHLADYVEPQLEDHWFRPILDRLGHVYEGQAGVPGLNAGVKRPDYVFFPDEAARQAAVSAQNTAEYAAQALAVGEVKRWDAPLGKKQRGGGGRFEAQNPSWQIDYYVRSTGLDWGILSNGRLWRLVHRDSSQRLSIYYEVDLVDLLRRDDPGAMRYFSLFFRQAAFRPDAGGRVFVADALAASNAYAVALEEDLEQNVYRALEHLMQGFLDLPGNGLGPDDVRRVYDNSLYLLYRLLFILYAESRDLLPLDRTRYREHYSLTDIKGDIARGEMPTLPQTTVTWSRLQALFRIINGDDPALNRELGVPRYDGRLFNPELHPFLEEKAVGDRALVAAIDLLCRRQGESGGREFVDYRTLGVRHLGSIYEGLLEYQPRYATASMIAVRDGKGERWVAESTLGPGKTPKVVDRRRPGQVYLETDRGERKATGSYYTPQYVVEYIVEHTLGPLVDEAVARTKDRVEAAQGKAARVEAEQSLAGEILDLHVLDPAMGSGHFLVEATEFLALALATDPYLETDAPAEEDLTHWRRRVVERCIYGVDKNPLAVELAKLSLWLATVAADKPLSFLDHHLKCGDSLIGARVEDLGEAPPVMLNKKALKERKARYAAGARQANLFETRLIEKLPVVMGRILEITEVESKDYDTVRAKEAADRAVRDLKAPFEAVANLWTSAYFGNEFVNGEYDEALMSISRPEELMALPAVQRAREMADERCFFHWELAFPEVFYDEHGKRLGERAGFDAVVGNPPYIPNEQMHDEERAYYPLFYPVSLGKYDLSVVFLTRGASLLSSWRRLGMIVPITWQTGDNYIPFREDYFGQGRFGPSTVINLPFDVFSDAYIDTTIAILERPASAEFRVFAYPKRFKIDRIAIPAEDFGVVSMKQVEDETQHRIFVNSEHYDFLDKFREPVCVDLGNLTDSCQGPVESFFEYSDSPDGAGYLPFVNCDVYRYKIEVTERKFMRFGEDNPLKRFYVQPRILIRRIVSRSDRLMATLVEEPFVVKKDLNPFISTEPGYDLAFLLALVNSALCSYLYIEASTTAGKDDFRQTTLTALRAFPIRRIDFTTPAAERQALGDEAVARYRACLDGGDDASLAAFVGARLEAEPEQADVVHDLLAALAGQMIDLHRRKQAAVESFWLDLEGVADAGEFDTLRNRGKWEATLWKQAACRPFVGEDSRSARRLDESLGWSEEAFKSFVKALVGTVSNLSGLVGVYRAHAPTYGDLARRIARTDRLIDRVVYQLYGLTADEIAIVEGQKRSQATAGGATHE